jgi:outer membrane receptor protein involved in Fe transport
MPRITVILFLLSFQTLFAQESLLYNGPEYTFAYHGFRGHPFFESDSLHEGEVLYDGILFKHAQLGYNIADDVLYVRDYRHGNNIRLLKEKVSWFTISGKKFVNLPASENFTAGFYQLLYNGHVKVFASHQKELKQALNAYEPRHFVQYDAYYFQSGTRIVPVKNLSSIIAAVPDKKEELKKFAHSRKLNIRKRPQTDIVKVADFYERSTVWKEKVAVAVQRPVIQRPVIQKIAALDENRVFEFGSTQKQSARSTVTLAGYVKDSKTGESIIGATVSSGTAAVVTDQFGYYSLTLAKGRHEIRFSSSGMNDARRQVILNEDGKLDIELSGKVASLRAVEVVAEKNSNVKSTQMSVEKLAIKTIKQVPVVFGEADVLRVVTTLPGVSSAGEAGTGFNVRGGSTDQNLILFNEATIYNPSHVFGFFSAFNPDLIKSVELYKSTIPEKFGGRLSSVLDVTVKEGNSKKISGNAGIGPLTSKLTIEGPLFSDKTTFIAGARTTYSNWLLRTLNTDYKDSRASFYDVSMNLSHTINAKNNIYLSGYMSNDEFRLNNDTTYRYGNKNWNIRWKHIFNNKLYMVLSGGQDQYEYAVRSKAVKQNAFDLGFDIRQSNFRADFNYSPNNSHVLNFGVNAIYYQLQPGSYQPNADSSLVTPKTLQHEQAIETAFYLGDKYTITDNLSLNAGVRYAIFNYLGPYNVDQYAHGIPKDTASITGTIFYPGGKVIQTYQAPEFRIGARYTLDESTSVKVSVNTTRQYIHMLSNTTIISPTDTWKLSDTHIKPQEGIQWSAGYYRNFRSNSIETSVEFYYKTITNMLDYKSGARLIMNEHIAADVIAARGKSYGAELMIKKVAGKLNGWISYTYSRTLLQQNDPTAGELINKGEYYPASFDKPHNLNFIGNYRFTHRFGMSLNFVYTTGRPITIPVAIFEQGNAERVYYSERNEYRIPDYMRADLSFTYEGNHKVKQRTHNSWSFGFYNLLARKNPYSVYFTQEDGIIKGYQLSIFGTIIPFVTLNIRF